MELYDKDGKTQLDRIEQLLTDIRDALTDDKDDLNIKEIDGIGACDGCGNV